MFRVCILLAGLALAYAGVIKNIANENCGKPAIPRTNPFIVGGTEAKAHTYPWMVSLMRRGSHICGGTLVSNQYIITAAHCVPGSGSTSGYSVLLGSHSRSGNDQGQVSRNLESIKLHENYNSQTINNDIAILKMVSPVEFTDTISPACIATKDYAAGTDTTVTGWGTMSSGAGSLPDKLREVDVPLIGYEQCSSWVSGVNSQTMICAGLENGGKDSCQGDSGGPLVVPDGGRWYLLGVVSWGYGCAGARSPGIYARVPHYTSWIKIHSDVK